MNNYSKLTKVLYYLIIALTALCFIIDIFLPVDKANLFYLACAILIMYLLPVVAAWLKVQLSPITLISCSIYLFVSLFLSNQFNLYKRFWFYDVILHTTSGFILVFFYSDVFYPLKSDKLYVREAPLPVKLAVPLLAAIASGGLWEICEFFVDLITHNDVQRNLTRERELISSDWQNPGILDTMNDMINGTVGAIIGTVILALEHYRIKKEAR